MGLVTGVMGDAGRRDGPRDRGTAELGGYVDDAWRLEERMAAGGSAARGSTRGGAVGLLGPDLAWADW